MSTQSGDYYLIKVTIPEGYSIQQITDLLDEKSIIDKKEITSYLKNDAKEDFILNYPFLADIPYNTLEGYLFPETYYFKKDEKKETIVKVMLNEFKKNIITLIKVISIQVN